MVDYFLYMKPLAVTRGLYNGIFGSPLKNNPIEKHADGICKVHAVDGAFDCVKRKDIQPS